MINPTVFAVQEGDAPIVAILNGHMAWTKLSKPQRALLQQHVTEINPAARETNRRYAIIPKVEASQATLDSLRRKDIVDDHDRLTTLGAYAVLYGPRRDHA